MVRELNNKIFLAISITILLVIVSCCSGTTNSSRKYYTGYNSLEMNFLSDSPPTTFYYDSEATIGSDVNTIPIHVQVQNKGSSDTFGALFIHGFDPNIVAIEGYSQSYPGYTGISRGSSIFSGWLSGSNYAFNIAGIDIGGTKTSGSTLNFGMANVNNRQTISFSTFNSGVHNRADLFSSLGFTISNSPHGANYVGISTGVIQGRVGSVLNPITKSMFNVYGWSGWLKSVELEGRNDYNPAGGMDVIAFPATIITLPPSLEEFRQRVMVTSCFDYATHASTMVCIDPEPYSNVRKACTANTVSLAGGQGAPVAVTSIEQKPGRGRTTFTINIKHSKTGTDDILYDYFNLYKCDPASGEIVKTTDKNVVYVGYVYLSDYDITMSCIPDQTIRLDESGNGQIICSIEFPEGIATSAYQAPIEIELWY